MAADPFDDAGCGGAERRERQEAAGEALGVLSGRAGARPSRGERIELVLEDVDERGRVLGRHEGLSVAVRGGTLGARVRARVSRSRRRGLEAEVELELVRSAERVEPRCPHFGSCGGCSFQDLAYRAQLGALERLLARTLAPLGRVPLAPVIGCETPWRYRNKMDFTFGRARWIEPHEPRDGPGASGDPRFALGLHARGHHHKVLDVRACEIAFEGAVPIVTSARELALARGLEPWDVRARTGLLRHLVLRRSWASGEILADLVTTEEAPALVGPYVEALLARHPEITTFVQHVNAGAALVASGDLARIFRGQGTIEERLAGLAFSISAGSFFQTNTPQAERLVGLVRERAAVGPGETAFDLYSGCGVFALALAAAARPLEPGPDIAGFELAPAAVQDARANAVRNGLERVRFVAGDLARTLLPENLRALGLPRPDVCIVDPPRAGMHARVLGALRALQPRTIVHVSCNPLAALRDLEVLVSAGWRLERVQPIDLFPHTPHLECVSELRRPG